MPSLETCGYALGVVSGLLTQLAQLVDSRLAENSKVQDAQFLTNPVSQNGGAGTLFRVHGTATQMWP
jgi:hypothetical protein